MAPSNFGDSSDQERLDPEEEHRAPQVGTRVSYFGDYELLEEIGRGGMGVVLSSPSDQPEPYRRSEDGVGRAIRI